MANTSSLPLKRERKICMLSLEECGISGNKNIREAKV
jgi:hypothetical protein